MGYIPPGVGECGVRNKKMKLIDLTIDQLFMALRDLDRKKYPHKALELSNEIERRKAHGEQPTIDIQEIVTHQSKENTKNRIGFFSGEGKHEYLLRGILYSIISFFGFLFVLLTIIIEREPINSLIWYLLISILSGTWAILCFKLHRNTSSNQ